MATIFNSALSAQRPDLADAIYQYAPDGVTFVADQIFPTLLVSEQGGQVEVVTRGSLLKQRDAARAAGGAYPRINDYLDKIDYVCKDYGLEIADNYGYRQTVQYNRELGKLRHIKMGLMLARETRALNALFDTSVWTGSALASNAGTAWATTATTDPRADIIAAKRKVRDATGINPNALVLSEQNLDYLLMNAKIRAEIQYSTVPTDDQVRSVLPALFGLERLIVSGARYDASSEGRTTTETTSVANDNYVSVARVGRENDPSSPSVGFTAVFDEDSGLPYVVESYWEDKTRSMIYRVRHNVVEFVADKAFAHLVKVGDLGT